MTERRVAKIVGERQRLRQILVEPKRARKRACDLRDLKRMGQPRPEMVTLMEDENLRFVTKPAKGTGVDDPVAIPAEVVARGTRRLWMQPAPAHSGIGRI